MPPPITPPNVRNVDRRELHRTMRENAPGSPAHTAVMAELDRRRAYWRMIVGGGALLLIAATALGIALVSVLRLLLTR